MTKRKYSKLIRPSVPGIKTPNHPISPPDSPTTPTWRNPFRHQSSQPPRHDQDCACTSCSPRSPRHTEHPNNNKKHKPRRPLRKCDCIDLRFPEKGYVVRSESIDEGYEDVPEKGTWTEEAVRVEWEKERRSEREERRRVGRSERVGMRAEFEGVSAQQLVCRAPRILGWCLGEDVEGGGV